MKFLFPLIAVKNMEVSKKFYHDLFDQEVAVDFGKNVTLSGGIVLQEDFDWLLGIPKESIVEKSHNMELYLEVEDFEAFLERLKAHPRLEYVHDVKQYDWLQRVVRIYDPDHHIIEIGESMEVIVTRCLKEGHSVEETVKMTQHPVQFVEYCKAKMEGRIAEQ